MVGIVIRRLLGQVAEERARDVQAEDHILSPLPDGNPNSFIPVCIDHGHLRRRRNGRERGSMARLLLYGQNVGAQSPTGVGCSTRFAVCVTPALVSAATSSAARVPAANQVLAGVANEPLST